VGPEGGKGRASAGKRDMRVKYVSPGPEDIEEKKRRKGV